MSLFYLSAFLISFVAVFLIIPPTKKWALKAGFMDVPAGVKDHGKPTPLGGGVAVMTGSVIVLLILIFLFDFPYSKTAVGILSGTVLIVFIGLYDDYYEMGAMGKMFGQVIAALIFLTFVENRPPILSTAAFYVLSVLWIIGLQNAINFIDNLDGLCGGISLAIAVGFGVLFILKGMPLFAAISFILAGSALAFLRYNLSPASIFLGDGGSLLFGFALAALGIVHLNTSKNMTAALSPVLIMAFPIFDMTLVTITRLNKGRKVYIASKDHAWDMIRGLGMTRQATVLTIVVINIILVGSGVALFFMGESPYQILTVVAFALLLAFIGTQLYKNFLYIRDSVKTIIGDIAAVNLAFIIYYLIKYHSGILEYSVVVPLETLAVPLAWINAFWIILYAAIGFYDISYEDPLKKHIAMLFKSILAGGIIFILANYQPGTGLQISIISILLFLSLLFSINVLFRALLYWDLTARFRYAAVKLNAVIVNPGSNASSGFPLELFAKRYNLIGYIGNHNLYDLENLGQLDDISDILSLKKTARIILDMDESSCPDLVDIFKSAFYMETVYLCGPGAYPYLNGLKIYRTNHKDVKIISIRHFGLFPQLLKRIMDIALGLISITAVMPFIAFGLIKDALNKKLSFNDIQIVSAGVRQARLRRYSTSPVSSLRGWWLLLAVIKGDISYYGVTITTVDEYKSLMNAIPGYWRKFLVRPGLFGPGYSGSSPEERFALDLAYMENASFLGDLKMMLKHLLGLKPAKIREEKYA